MQEVKYATTAALLVDLYGLRLGIRYRVEGYFEEVTLQQILQARLANEKLTYYIHPSSIELMGDIKMQALKDLGLL